MSIKKSRKNFSPFLPIDKSRDFSAHLGEGEEISAHLSTRRGAIETNEPVGDGNVWAGNPLYADKTLFMLSRVKGLNQIHLTRTAFEESCPVNQ